MMLQGTTYKVDFATIRKMLTQCCDVVLRLSYYYMRKFCNLIGSAQCISASFEIPTCENYKTIVGSSINK